MSDIENQQVLKKSDFDCSVCGKEKGFSVHYSEPLKSKLLSNKTCFKCDFWSEYVNNKSSIVIDGDHYVDCGNDSSGKSDFLGHGGRVMKIIMHSGEKVKTNNLWSQGKIPKSHKSLIKNNAEWA